MLRIFHQNPILLSLALCLLALFEPSTLSAAPIQVKIMGNSSGVTSHDAAAVAAELNNMLAVTPGYTGSAASASVVPGDSLIESFYHPTHRAATRAVLAAKYDYLVILPETNFLVNFPEATFDGVLQMSRRALNVGSTPLLLMPRGGTGDSLTTMGTNAYRIGHGCGIATIPGGYAVSSASLTAASGALNLQRQAYLLAATLFTKITGLSAASTSYLPSNAGTPIDVANLAGIAVSTLNTHVSTAHYATSRHLTGAVRYRNITPPNNRVRFAWMGTSSEIGIRNALNDIIPASGHTAASTQGTTSGSKEWEQPTFDNVQPAFTSFPNEFLFVYGRGTQIAGQPMIDFSQANMMPVVYDRHYDDIGNGSASVNNVLNDIHGRNDWLRYYNNVFSWMAIPMHLGAARLNDLDPSIVFSTDNVHMSAPLYNMVASMMFTSALGKDPTPSATILASSQLLNGFNVGRQTIKELAYLSETTAFVPETNLAVTSPDTLTKARFESFTHTFTASGGTSPYTWSETSTAGLPAGLSLSAAGVLSGSVADAATTRQMVIRVTDSAGAIRKIPFALTTIEGPGSLTLTPASGLSFAGNPGGPFLPATHIYTLNNPGTTTIQWTAAKTAPWLTLSGTSGTLASGESATVTIAIDSSANSLTSATYNDTITFTNTTSGLGNTTRAVALTVNPIPATITLGNLNPVYDGNPKPVSVTTNPPGLSHTVAYNGSATAPTNGGTYPVVATITAPNYSGSASANLVIGKASQTITFGPLGTVPMSGTPIALTGSASSGLAISYSSLNTAVATISGSDLNTIGIGTSTITASQAGNSNYNAAAQVQQTITVNLVNPVAVPGGPYRVFIGGLPLSLNGSASLPSDGGSITSYSWDLNNNGIFGDVTGASPTAIPYIDLFQNWLMRPGLYTIRLQITDSAGKTSEASTTVELIDSLIWDANAAVSGQTNGAGAWLGASMWWDGTANLTWTSGSNATFGGLSTAGGAVTLANPTTVNALTFNSFTGTYTLGTTGQTLTINGGITVNASAGATTISSPIMLGGAQTWTNHSANTLTISGALGNGGHTLTVDGSGFTNFTAALAAGGGGLTKNGAGRLQFNNAVQLYTGPTIVNGGVLSYGDTSAQLSAANITLNGGVMDQRWTTIFTRALGTGSNQIQLTGGASGFSNNNGSHTVLINNSATTEMVWGAANEAGNLNATGLFNPSTLVLQSAFTQNNSVLTFGNNIDLNATTRTIQVNAGIGGASAAAFTGVIRTSSGTAGMIKTGGGILILNAANTYNGTTTISGGTLRIGNNSAGTLGGGSYSANISVASGATLQIWSTAAQALSGAISGGGGLQKAYGGALTLSGPNTYTGRTSFLPQTVAGFTVNITSFNSVNGGTPLMLSSSLGAPTTIPNGTIDVGSTTAQAGVNLNYTGSGETTDRVINFGFNGSASQTLTASGSGLLKFTSAMTGNSITTQSGALVLRGTGSGEITQALPALPSGGLSKNDNGTWTLGGANSYTGPTAITAGKLFINGNQSTAAGNVTVAANATLGGFGTIGGNTIIATGGRLEFNINTSAASHDRLDLASGDTLTFSGSSVLTITSTAGASIGTYTLLTAPGGITGVAPATLNLPANWAATVSISGNSLLLNVTSTGTSYTVTYNGNSATSGTVPTAQTKLPDVNLTLATNSGNLARSGYTFAGWNTAANGSGTSYATSTTYTANAPLALFAQWTMLPYTSWMLGSFANPFTDTALTSNPDGDTFTNLLEFAFGMDPTSPITGSLVYVAGGDVLSAGSPILQNFAAVGQPADYRAVFARRKDYITAGLTYTVQCSADLGLWTVNATAPTLQTGAGSAGNMEAVSVPFPVTVPLQGGGSAPPKFLRVALKGH